MGYQLYVTESGQPTEIPSEGFVIVRCIDDAIDMVSKNAPTRIIIDDASYGSDLLDWMKEENVNVPVEMTNN